MIVLICIALIAWLAVGAVGMFLDREEIGETILISEKSEEITFTAILSDYCGPVGWLAYSIIAFLVWTEQK
jgi:hypothetical protein